MIHFTVEFVGGPRDGELQAFPAPIHELSFHRFDGADIHRGVYRAEKPITDDFPLPHRFVWAGYDAP